jgi:hypothetical protein
MPKSCSMTSDRIRASGGPGRRRRSSKTPELQAHRKRLLVEGWRSLCHDRTTFCPGGLDGATLASGSEER